MNSSSSHLSHYAQQALAFKCGLELWAKFYLSLGTQVGTCPSL